MKHLLFAALACVALSALSGCGNNGKEKLSEVKDSQSATGTTSGGGPAETGSTTGSSPIGGATSGTPGNAGSAISGTSTPLNNGSAPTKNPALDSKGQEVKFDGQNPPPEGRVWCDNCHGHLPKEDAVTVDGKTVCPACAEELKNKK